MVLNLVESPERFKITLLQATEEFDPAMVG